MLVERVLKGISDTRAVSDHKPGRLPVDVLVEAYNKKVAHVDELPNMTPLSTGRELKEAILAMDSEDQVELLYVYLQASGELPGPLPGVPVPKPEVETEDQEDHKLKIFLTKVTILLASAVILIVTGATAMVAVREGHAANNPALVALWHTAKEVLTVITGGED
jgi:hypothetical protein